MPIINDPPVWAGVVIQFADGRTYAVELDGRQSLITASITTEIGIGETEASRRGETPWREEEPDGTMAVEVHLRGEGRHWRHGWQAPNRPDGVTGPRQLPSAGINPEEETE